MPNLRIGLGMPGRSNIFAPNVPFSLTGALPGGRVGTAYSATLALGGTFTAPVTIGASVGVIPAWMTVGVAGNTVTLSGTPPTAETETFTLQATDAAARTATDPQSVVIAPPYMIDFKTAAAPTDITFTSGGGKTYFKADGLLYASVANEWPLEFDPVTHVVAGRSKWETRTNLARYSQDLTLANWVKTGGTVAKDQTDLFGVLNNDCSFTATAANATVLQAITRASANACYSVWLKRITGVGAVSITLDGGVTWTAVTLTATPTRFYVGALVTNPSFGVQLATAGDVVAVLANQCENALTPSPYIQTVGNVAVARAAEAARLTNLAAIGFNAAAGTLVCEGTTGAAANASAANAFAVFSDGTAANYLEVALSSSSNMRALSVAASATQAQMLRTPAPLLTATKAAFSWAAGNFAFSLNGGAVAAVATGTVPTVSQLDIGDHAETSGKCWNGVLSKMTYYASSTSAAQLVTL